MRGLSQNLGKGFHTFVKFVGGAFWTHFVSVHLVVRLAIFLPFKKKNFLLSCIVLIDHHHHQHHSQLTHDIPITYMHYDPRSQWYMSLSPYHYLPSPLLIITSYHIILSQPCIVLYIHDLHSHYHISTISNHYPPIDIIIILTIIS